MAKVNVQDVSFLPLLDQSEDVIEAVRQMRNAEGVRRYMYQEHIISPEEHRAWVQSLRGNDRERFMVVECRNELVGVVALRNIRMQDRAADWAFYLSEAVQGKGVGGVVEYKLLQLAFGELSLHKLNCEVLETNPAVIEMHQKFGFKVEGVRRANVMKEDRRLDVYLLGILPDEWAAQRDRFARLFGDEAAGAG